jgi:YihY family inner membrane protein
MATAAQKKNVDASAHGKRGLFLHRLQNDTKPLQAFINKFNNDWVMNFAGIMAYNLIVAILPIAIALLGIAGLILSGNQSFETSIIAQSAHIPGLQSFVQLAIKQLRKDAGILLIIAIIISLFGGSRLFVTLEGILDILYRVRPRTLIPQNLVAIGMLVIFIILIPIMVLASAIPSFFSALLTSPTLKSIPVINNLTTGVGALIIGGIVSVAVGLLLAFILFEAIYIVVPNQKISWRNSWRGAASSAVLLETFLVAFPFYVTHFLGGYGGQIGLVIILLVFFYYFAVILLLGGEVNAFFSEKVQPLPNDLVTFVSTMGGKLNHDIPAAESDPHIDTHPTDLADKAHIAHELQNTEKVETPAAPQTKKKQTPNSGKLTAVLAATAGTMLAFFFQMQQLRQHKK